MFWLKTFIVISLYTLYSILYTPSSYAIVDPLSVPNNKFGIHIIQATPDESSPAASLVNSTGGDWGYITVVIEGKDKNKDKWQEFFNDLRRRHLIPIVRLASIPDSSGFWKIPDIGEAQVWADFLNTLNWPIKNRYVTIYNEPNHGNEWGNKVDAKSYAETLDKTIAALKNKNQDFFVLNAGFDASTPQELPRYQEESSFLQDMNEEVPGVFNKLDGWVSHSYPNPGFVGSPDGYGKGTVRTYQWELQQLANLGVNKNLPVFITETGWKHAEGINYDPTLPTSTIISQYFVDAFEGAWNNSSIVAVTPFLLSYQEHPFDHFSFKRVTSKDAQIIDPNNPPAVQTPYYSQFQTISDLPKIQGKPIQDNLGKLIKGEIYSSMVAGQTYDIALTFKNTGQSIWNDTDQVKLVPIEGGQQLGIEAIEIPKDIKIEPDQEYTFNFKAQAPQSGSFKVVLNLFTGNQQFNSPPLQFATEVKSPVVLQVKTALKWKKDYSGEYLLTISGPNGPTIIIFNIGSNGISDEKEARFLLPDYTFDFNLERRIDYYGGQSKLITHKPTILRQTLQAGKNILDFGELQPNLAGNLIHPRTLWSILPFSN